METTLLNSRDEPDKTIDEIWAIEAERLRAYKEGNLNLCIIHNKFPGGLYNTQSNN